MAINDNREFIEALEKTKDVARIKQEVSWDLEVGAITRRVCERRDPAPFFENIKDYPKGYRIFGAPLATERRIAIAMGLEPDTPFREIQKAYARRLEHPVRPVIVDDAPCKENVLVGQDVDLCRFPAPMIHEGDGGRYLGTWHAVVAKSAERDWTNWGMYRAMILNKRHLTGLCEPYSHQMAIWKTYGTRNMPVAIVIGADPLCSWVSACRAFGRQDEADYAGALRQEPVALVKCETNDLLVPAHAEIILEGECLTGVRAAEGPFGEYPGYSTSPRSPQAVYRINAVTYRNDPILTMSSMGVPVDDAAMTKAIDLGVFFKKILKKHGMPVTDVYVPPEGISFLCVVGVKPIYKNAASQISRIFSANMAATYKIIVVSDDVDVFNMSEVLHAFAAKCHPARGTKISADEIDFVGLIPYTNPEEKKMRQAASVVFDCTWPFDWSKEITPRKMSFNEAYPNEIQEKVLQNWRDYGYE
jgi:phenylphosphate carboxylase alpha subunit